MDKVQHLESLFQNPARSPRHQIKLLIGEIHGFGTCLTGILDKGLEIGEILERSTDLLLILDFKRTNF